MAMPKIAGFSLPFIILAVAAAIGGGVAVALLTEGDGGGGPVFITPTPTSTPGSVGTITAQGEIAYVTSDQKVGLTDPTGAASQVISDFDGVTSVYWSIDGSMLAADVTLGRERVVVITPAGDVLFEVDGAGQPQWSPVDNRLLVVRQADAVVLDDTGAELTVVPSAAGPVWSPDGGSIAYLRIDDGTSTLAMIDLDTGEESDLRAADADADPSYAIAWRPTGELIAYRDSLYDLATGGSEPLEGVPVSWSPDGRWLLQTLDQAEGEGTNARLFDFDQDGVARIGFYVRDSIQGDPPWVYIQRWLAWNADGTQLVYLDPRPFAPVLRLYNTVDDPSQRPDDRIEGVDPDFSPSDTHIAFSQREKLWVYAVDASALVNILDGIRPQWRPGR